MSKDQSKERGIEQNFFSKILIDLMAKEEASKGIDNLKENNYNEACNHFMKSVLFDYNDDNHTGFSIAVAKCFLIALKSQKFEDIKPLAFVIEHDQLSRDIIASELFEECKKQLKNNNLNEALKYLMQSYILESNFDIKENILEICFKDFMINFEKYIENINGNNNKIDDIKTYLSIIMESSNKDKVKDIFASYLNNKGANYNKNKNNIMAEKYVELAASLSNAQNIIKNLDIAKQNLKNSEENNIDCTSWKDKEEYENNKKLTEEMNNLISSNYNNDYINSWIKKNQAMFNKNTFKNELVLFNNEYSKNENFFDVINDFRNCPIEIVNSILKKKNETSNVIGIGLKKIFYIELDYKNWMINIGAEYGRSFWSCLKKLLGIGIGYSEDFNYYGEININLKPKNLKDIFDYDHGIAKSTTFETPFFYHSTIKSQSLKNDNDN